MGKYRKNTDIEAYTFDELELYGLKNTKTRHDKKPWSFTINGISITYENDSCYLVRIPETMFTLTRNSVLIFDNGLVFSMSITTFKIKYHKI